MKNKKVIIGMSGGVDSSVAAKLLIDLGYTVEGLFMRNWDSTANSDYLGNPTLDEDICPQEQDYNDAKTVCDKLNIPLHRVDFVEEYWDNVFKYFLDELNKGRTPNPDIMCNKYIKFDYFTKKAIELDADFIATGHYVKLEDGYLKKAIDNNKDQSYFLSQVSQKQLENVLFPLGNLKKSEVRKIAEDNDLITYNKKDSTGICFIGERNFKQFLTNYLPNMEGDIVDIDTSTILGKHHGLMYYTIGQRKGLNVGGTIDKLFVVGKNLEKNILYVSLGDDTKYLYSTSCVVDSLNFNCDLRPTSCFAKFRYRQEDIKVNIEYKENEIIVTYDDVKAVTPGQACVLYDNDICIGGGIIKEVRKEGKKLWYLL